MSSDKLDTLDYLRLRGLVEVRLNDTLRLYREAKELTKLRGEHKGLMDIWREEYIAFNKIRNKITREVGL